MFIPSLSHNPALRKSDIELEFISIVKKRTLNASAPHAPKHAPKKLSGGTISHDSLSAQTLKEGLSSQIDKLTYNEFLTCLMKLSAKLYPNSTNQGMVESSFQQLLMENILPLASRRAPKSIDALLATNGEIAGLFNYFHKSLIAIFEFYASEGLQSNRAKAGARGMKNTCRDFDELQDESRARLAASGNGEIKGTMKTSPNRSMSGTSVKSGAIKQNSMTSSMSYSDFIHFSSDFCLTSKVLVTMIDLGDVYLSGVANATGTASVRKLRFGDFQEVLVRVALMAYANSPVSPADKTRGILLYMWRQIQTSINKEVTSLVSSSRASHKGGLLRGAQLFNERFIAMWQQDGYKDYLLPEKEKTEEGRDVLTRLLDGGGGLDGFLPKPPTPKKKAHESKKVGMRNSNDSDRSGIPFQKARHGGGSSINSFIDLEDDDASKLGDLGISPEKLRELLIRRPDLAEMLQRNLVDAGLEA
jgi:hypothetical protein